MSSSQQQVQELSYNEQIHIYIKYLKDYTDNKGDLVKHFEKLLQQTSVQKNNETDYTEDFHKQLHSLVAKFDKTMEEVFGLAEVKKLAVSLQLVFERGGDREKLYKWGSPTLKEVIIDKVNTEPKFHCAFWKQANHAIAVDKAKETFTPNGIANLLTPV